MDKHAHGVSFCCPFQLDHHWQSNDSFVDDTTGFANHFLPELHGQDSLASVIHAMTSDAQLWNDLLHISGGKLEFSKCLYYVLHWHWQNGKAHLTSASELGTDLIQLSDEHDVSTVVEHRDCRDTHLSLIHI